MPKSSTNLRPVKLTPHDLKNIKELVEIHGVRSDSAIYVSDSMTGYSYTCRVQFKNRNTAHLFSVATPIDDDPAKQQAALDKFYAKVRLFKEELNKAIAAHNAPAESQTAVIHMTADSAEVEAAKSTLEFTPPAAIAAAQPSATPPADALSAECDSYMDPLTAHERAWISTTLDEAERFYDACVYEDMKRLVAIIDRLAPKQGK